MAHISAETLGWRPARESSVPLHEQIVAWVKGQVSSGAWPLGSRLPTQRALADALGVNRSTLVEALTQLTDYGIIEGKGAAGTFVASDSWSIMLADRAGWQRRGGSQRLRDNPALLDAIARRRRDTQTICLGSGALDAELFPMNTWNAAVESMSGAVGHREAEPELGLSELRRELAGRLKARGVDADEDRILVTNGNLQSMRLLCQGLVGPGVTMLVGRPTYAKSLTSLAEAGVHLTEVDCDADGVSPTDLGEAARRCVRGCVLYTMPVCHNPTGHTMSATRRTAVLNVCDANRIPVIEDGAFDELSFSGASRPLAADDEGRRVIYLGSASKSFAPGLRVGWICASSQVIGRLAEIKRATDYANATPSELMMARLLATGAYDEHLVGLRQALQARCDAACESLSAHLAGVADWTRPDGGYFVWVRFKRPVNKEQLFIKALSAGVMLNVHDMFDNRANDRMRLSFAAVDPDRFDLGVSRIAAVVNQVS